MDYISTRSETFRCSSAEAILRGIAPDGGLLLPEVIPELALEHIPELCEMSYPERVAEILSLYLNDFSRDELLEYASAAYAEPAFPENPCPLTQMNAYNDKVFMLELWHGPTSAFKDMALQLLPYLMTASARKLGIDEHILILTATSGDTGKAALAGFSGVEGCSVAVFYPKDGVAERQKLQMVTHEAENTHVIAVEGSFDDAQTGVKKLFADSEFNEQLAQAGIRLSSANSINWGRLVPQIAYYWSAYCDLVKRELIEVGQALNFAVPTGNFGNILAAWYAGRMGLPINKLICASNRNNVLSDFLQSGRYNMQRQFYKTETPSMDILLSSNLERLLFELSYQNSSYVQQRMQSLCKAREYSVGPEMLNRLRENFVGGFTDDKGVRRTILDIYDQYDHVLDPHSAVAFNVYHRYERRSGDEHPTVFVATASPFKFPKTVCHALYPERNDLPEDEQALMEILAEESGLPIPPGLDHLEERVVRHQMSCPPDMMGPTLLKALSGTAIRAIDN